MKKIVVFTGAGISAESGIKTFRDSGGLWENYDIKQVATPEAWKKDPKLVLKFYNERRKQIIDAKPNSAHLALTKLEKKFDIQIITQNIDDLHERAGSEKVLHLHGEIKKARSTADPKLIYPITGWELKIGDKCTKGSQLRPHIVWFGEEVPEMSNAINMVKDAELLLVIGTSLNVYPAAGLINYINLGCKIILIDPNTENENTNFRILKTSAGIGVPLIVNELITEDKK